MADIFDDEEDDFQRLKNWWKANGLSLVIGIVVGLAIVGGWKGWGWYQERQAQDASAMYYQFKQALASGADADKLDGLARNLQSDHAGSPYATAAGLAMGHYYAGKDKYGKAVKNLQWVVDHGGQPPFRQLARLREARLQWAQGDSKKALALLAHKHPASFEALYAELAGDIHASAGDDKQAATAYQRALKNLPQGSDSRLLKEKLNSVASATGDAVAS